MKDKSGLESCVEESKGIVNKIYDQMLEQGITYGSLDEFAKRLDSEKNRLLNVLFIRHYKELSEDDK